MPKISELPDADVLTGAEYIPIDQAGVTKRVTAGALGLGGGGGTSDNFSFTQSTPASVWTITHNLGRFPSVTVSDSTGRVVEGDINYVSVNQLTVTFIAAFSGSAYCN